MADSRVNSPGSAGFLGELAGWLDQNGQTMSVLEEDGQRRIVGQEPFQIRWVRWTGGRPARRGIVPIRGWIQRIRLFRACRRNWRSVHRSCRGWAPLRTGQAPMH